MQIQSGTTSDRRTRIIIMLVMCAGLGAWFGRDGLMKYPAENLKWARESMGSVPDLPQADKLESNPRVRMANLEEVRRRLESASDRSAGLPLSEVEAVLGKSAFTNGTDHCYIGPAAFAWFKGTSDRILSVERMAESTEHSEMDITGQKVLAGVLFLGALATLIHLVRVLTSRVVLDEAGLRIGGRTIAWDAMTRLDTDTYQRKGWLDLVYQQDGREASVRLDSYHIDRFTEIVIAICARKGFPSPLRTAAEPAFPVEPGDPRA